MKNDDLSEFLKIKARAETAKREYERAVGARNSFMTRIQNEWKVKTIEELIKKRDKLEKEIKALEKELETKLRQFNDDFGHLLES